MAQVSAKPEAIVAAAQRLFLRSGLRQTSMDAIAAEAGVAKQTVYRYYGSKDRLFVEALRSATVAPLQADVDALTGILPSTPGQFRETLLTLATRILDIVLDRAHLALVRVVVAEANDFPELGALFESAVVDGARSLLTRVVRAGAIAESVPVDDVHAALRLFWAPLLSYEVEGLLHGPEEVRERARRELPMLVDLFVAAISSPTAGIGAGRAPSSSSPGGGS
jgi:TetR/AcrR family transcriptional regulator, mexJK operon transcriptional repressor